MTSQGQVHSALDTALFVMAAWHQDVLFSPGPVCQQQLSNKLELPWASSQQLVYMESGALQAGDQPGVGARAASGMARPEAYKYAVVWIHTAGKQARM